MAVKSLPFGKIELRMARETRISQGMKKAKSAQMPPAHLNDHAAMADRVEEGLPIQDVMEFGKQAGFTTDELAKLIHIPPRTYARRVAAHARLKIPEGERAVRVMRLYDTAKQLFGTHDDTRRWLSMELPALGRRTPLDLARTEQGARAVETLIGQIEHGIVT
jgi:putative toxin-antitoxin system antitoxin component (TIGR02293 family)